MSNFTGVTFAKQKVLPSDDAIIRRAILSDGILYGCELSYSGSTLTMGAGHLLICGRQARHPSAQNWAVVGATSGYARLVLTVDLSRTASKDYFDQIKDSVEYASAVDGFPELEQADVNVSGTRYQVVACVVSLGTGGITGFVSKLGPCEVAGGGGLNFKLVGGLTQPADPAENKIWVETDTAITFYDFSATEPAEPVENMVWISLGTSSPAAFNALKKNSVMVYPISAKQYVSGAWVYKRAKIYQNGKWVGLVTYLFKEGTGVGSYPFYTSAESGQVTVNSNAVVFTGTNGKAYLTQNAVSFAEKKTFCVEATVSYIGSSSEWQGSVVVKSAAHFSTEAGKQNPSTSVARTKFSANNSRTVYRVSVPTGSYHVGVSGDIQGKIHNMWIE